MIIYTKENVWEFKYCSRIRKVFMNSKMFTTSKIVPKLKNVQGLKEFVNGKTQKRKNNKDKDKTKPRNT